MLGKPKIVFLNQSIDPSFLQLLIGVADRVGECVLYTGSYISGQHDHLRICHAPSYNNSSYFSRLWTWSLYMLYVTLACLFMPGPQLLFVASNPPFLPLLARFLHCIRGWKYIILVWDIYPDVLVRFGVLVEPSLIVKLWRHLNKQALSHAEVVITISQGMAETLQTQFIKNDVPIPNFQILPTWVDTDRIQPIPKSENWFAQKYQQVEKLTILYSGNMGATHDVSSLVQAAARLKHIDDIAFLLIGGGPGYEIVKEAIVQQRLENVTLLPYQPQEVIPFSMPTGDIAIVSLDSGAEGLSMPSKTYFMMAAGCALLGISQAQSDLANLVQKHEIGVNIAPGDVEALVVEIQHFHKDREYLRQCQTNARYAAVNHFSAEHVLQKYTSLLVSLSREEHHR